MRYLRHPLFWIAFGLVIFPDLTVVTADLINFAFVQLRMGPPPAIQSSAWAAPVVLERLLPTVFSALCAWLWAQGYFLSARLTAIICGGVITAYLFIQLFPQPSFYGNIFNYSPLVEVLLWPVCLVAFGFLARQPAHDDSFSPTPLTRFINPRNFWYFVGYVVFPLICLTSELSIFALRSALGVHEQFTNLLLGACLGSLFSLVFGAPLGAISQFCANEWHTERAADSLRSASILTFVIFFVTLCIFGHFHTSDWILTFGLTAPPLLWSACLVLLPFFARVPKSSP